MVYTDVAEKEKELQELVTDVAEISTKMGMCINTTKLKHKCSARVATSFRYRCMGNS